MLLNKKKISYYKYYCIIIKKSIKLLKKINMFLFFIYIEKKKELSNCFYFFVIRKRVLDSNASNKFKLLIDINSIFWLQQTGNLAKS